MKSSHQITLGILLVIVLYVLSPGPVIAYYAKAGSADTPPAVQNFYRPLEWCCKKAPPFASAMTWYIYLWYYLVGVAPAPCLRAIPPACTAIQAD